MNNTINPNSGNKLKPSIILICLMFLYPLLAMSRIKAIGAPIISGMTGTNQVWIIPVLFLIIKFFSIRRGKSLKIMDSGFLVALFLLFIVLVIGGFNAVSIEQYLYAIALFTVPILLLFTISKSDINYLGFFLKFFIFVCLAYSLFSIFASINYQIVMDFIGLTNYSGAVNLEGQYRARTMIGSAITVAFYYNLSLPLLFYMYFSSRKTKWEYISLISIVMNLIATFLTLSRAGFYVAILVSLLCITYQIKHRSLFRKKLLVFCSVIIGFVYIAGQYNIGRLFEKISFITTDFDRFEGIQLALHIFKVFPIFGSGMGHYFIRMYEYRYLQVDGFYGLVDPHNLYVLLLSEIGFIGFALVIILFILMIKKISIIKDIMFRKTGYIMLFAMALGALGGSQLANEISYASVFWIYMSVFYAASYLDAESIRKFTISLENRKRLSK